MEFCVFCIKPKKHKSYDCSLFKNKKFIKAGLKKIKNNVKVYDIFIEYCIKYLDFGLFKKLVNFFPTSIMIQYKFEKSYILGSSLFYINKHKKEVILSKIITLIHNSHVKYSIVEIYITIGFMCLGIKNGINSIDCKPENFYNIIPYRTKLLIYTFKETTSKLNLIKKHFSKIKMDIANIIMNK